MNSVRYAVLASTLGIALGCAPASTPSSSEEDVAAITRASQEWVAAFEAEDVPRAMSFLASDAVLVPPHEPPLSGAEAIEAWTRRMFEAITVESANTTVDEVRVAGDWAVSHGVWQMSLTMNGVTVGDTTRYVLIWERQADGTWLIVYDVWNSALAAAEGG
jgi:uncharacterized protein (TIGR02246 family)